MMIARNRGFSLVEMMVAGVVATALIGICVQMLASASRQRRSAERRAVALQEAENVIESIGALDWEEVIPERLAQYQLSDGGQAALVHGQLRVVVEPGERNPPSKLIRVKVSWPGLGSGETTSDDALSVRLSTWAFPRTKVAAP
jgi:type II secretory pathway pseudopilin PulG